MPTFLSEPCKSYWASWDRSVATPVLGLCARICGEARFAAFSDDRNSYEGWVVANRRLAQGGKWEDQDRSHGNA